MSKHGWSIAALLPWALILGGCLFAPRLPEAPIDSWKGPESVGLDRYAPPKPPANESDKERLLRLSQEEAIELRGKLAKVEARIEVQEDAVRRERNGWLVWLNRIIAGLAVLGIPVCIGLGIWLKSRGLFYGAVAAVGVLAATMCTDWALDNPGWMIAGCATLMGISGAFLVWHLWDKKRAGEGAVRVANVLKPLADLALGGDEKAEEKRKELMTKAAGTATKAIDRARRRLGF